MVDSTKKEKESCAWQYPAGYICWTTGLPVIRVMVLVLVPVHAKENANNPCPDPSRHPCMAMHAEWKLTWQPRKKQKRKKNLSTWTSERVPHIRTIHARSGLTSLCGWEAVLSTGYGRDIHERSRTNIETPWNFTYFGFLAFSKTYLAACIFQELELLAWN